MGKHNIIWKRYPIHLPEINRTWGIMGTAPQVGTTFMAILLASYMSGLFWKKTAVLELNSSGDFLKIMKQYGESQKEGMYFCHKGVDYYPAALETSITHCLSQDYRCIIIDFGCDYIQGRNEFLRCQKKIVMGSTVDWEIAEYMDFVRWTKRDQEDGWLYAAVFGSRKNRVKIERMMHISIVQVPFLESPYWIDEAVMRFFQMFLK